MNSKIRPKQGQVLVELFPAPHETETGLCIPDTVTGRDKIGRMATRMAIVRALGIWPTTKAGRPFAYEYRKGDRVYVDPVMGRAILGLTSPLRLYDHGDILAIVVPNGS